MVHPNSLKNLNKFSSTNQPDPEKKRVPKLKTRLKKEIAENYEEIAKALIDRCKKGDYKTMQFIKEWLYGKDTEKVESDNTIRVKVDYE